jgi:hypothetical protein
MPDWVNLAEPLGTIIGFVLTLMVFSYIFGDNVLFRLATHIFIGVAAGYAAVLVTYNLVYNIIFPILASPGDELLRLGPPVILGVWLLAKTSPKLSRLGNPVLAFLVGAGAAAAISGALLGTIFPLVDQSTRELADRELSYIILYGGIILVGTITTLIYFHYGAHPTPSGATRRNLPIEIGSLVGQVFIATTLGAIFAGVYLAVLSVFIERIFSMWDFLWKFDWKNFISLFS